MARHRTRRLRKKLHIGEFRQLGFELSFQVADDLPDEDVDALWDRFILEAIARNGLLFGGSESGGFVTGRGNASATDDHRRLVAEWLNAQPKVGAVMVGDLVDAWN